MTERTFQPKLLGRLFQYGAGADCKSVVSGSVGSIPTPPTTTGGKTRGKRPSARALHKARVGRRVPPSQRPQIDAKKVSLAAKKAKKTPLGALLQAEMRVLTLAMHLMNGVRSDKDWKRFTRACKDLKKADSRFAATQAGKEP